MSKLDDRSAVYVNPAVYKPDPSRVPLDLDETARARLAHLEGMVTALLDEVETLRKRMDEREGDHR